jgi:hypothetical protein
MTPSTLGGDVWRATVVVFLLTLLSAQAASASHIRPKGATPIRASLVPAQQQCVNPNGTHEPPLENVRSCLPPSQSASAATVGTPDANGFPAQSAGFVRIAVVGAGTTDEDDRVEVEITDVRDAKDPARPYEPDLTLVARIPEPPPTAVTGRMLRLTDHRNIGPGPVGGAGTTVDFNFPIPVDCDPTTVGIGSTCAVTTTFNSILPGFVKFDPSNPNRNRQTIEIGQVQVYDAGADGIPGSNDDTLFAVQGIFNP